MISLLVENIPTEADESQLRRVFAKCGRVAAITLLGQTTAERVCIVDMVSPTAALKALAAEHRLTGRRLRIEPYMN